MNNIDSKSNINIDERIKDNIEVHWLKNNKILDITQIVVKKTWEGDYKSSGRKCQIEVVNGYEDPNIPKADIKNGDVIKLIYKGKTLFCGNVLNVSKSNESNTFTYTVFDIGHRLLNKDNKIYKNKKAEEITKDILTSYKLPVGSLASTSKVMDKIFQSNTLYEIIMIAYTEASKVDKNKYMIAVANDKINVIKKGLNVLNIEFQEGKNITSANYDESIENIVTKVIAKDDKGNIKTVKEKKDWIKLYGMMQDIISINQKDTNQDATIEKAFKGPERTCKIGGFGDITSITGTAVYVKDNKTGLVGKFYVDSDKHTFEKGIHKIEMTINFQNIMDEKEGGEKKEEGAGATETQTKGGWREVPAEFTAY